MVKFTDEQKQVLKNFDNDLIKAWECQDHQTRTKRRRHCIHRKFSLPDVY